MRKHFLLFIVVIICFSGDLFSQEEYFLLYGGNGIDEGRSIVETPTGGYMISGRTRSFGSGSDDYYLVGLNSQLEILFDTPFGGPHQDRCHSIVYLENGTYGLLGHSWDFAGGRLNFNLTIVDAFGNFVERIMFVRDNRDLGLKMIKASDNGFILAGMVDITGLWSQMFIMKTDENFNIVWENNFGVTGSKDYVFDVIENKNGYLLVGTYSGFYGMYPTFPDFQAKSDIGIIQLDFNGNELWSYRYDGEDYDFGYSLCQVNDTNYVLGSTKSEGAGSFDILLLQLDTEGNLLNSFTYGGEGFEYGYKIISDSDQNLLIVGASNSNLENPALYVLKLNREGNVLFEKRIEGSGGAVYGYDVIENTSGNYLITGAYSINDSDSDVFLLAITKEGELISGDSNISFPSEAILIYPNPVSGHSTSIKTSNKEIKINFIEIFDALGRKIDLINYSNNQFRVRLDVSGLIKGYYILIVNLSNGDKNLGKLIVY